MRLVWNAVGERFYETGVDRGVLYVGVNPGVAWTGLISVSENPSGGEPRAFYQDGIKYANVASSEEFEATLTAFAAPPEFGPCEGVVPVQNGLFVTQQPRKAFGLSYRTMIGNDSSGKSHAYKIHLVYNALAEPAERNNNTLSDNVSLNELSWGITTLPPSLTGRKPTAHFVIDSRHTPAVLLSQIEDILYGTESYSPRLPSANELITIFETAAPVVRRNYAPDPTFRTLTGLWGASNGTISQGADGESAEIVQTGAAAAYLWMGDYGVPMVAGEIWSVRIDVESTQDVTLTPRFKYFTGANVETGVVAGPSQLLPADTAGSVAYLNVTVPAGAAAKGAFELELTGAAGATHTVRNVILEKAATAGPYFDGSTIDTATETYSWEGTPNASSSVLRSWN